MRRLVGLWCLLFGCVPSKSIDLPDMAPGDSMLLVAHDNSGNAQMFAFDDPGNAPKLSLRPQDGVLALVYKGAELPELFVEAGRVGLDPRPDFGRPLNPAYELHEAMSPNFDFVPVAETARVVTAETILGRWPMAEPDGCDDLPNSCRRYSGVEVQTNCELPCFYPEPLEPEPPILPSPPSFADCPASWAPFQVDTATACRPAERRPDCDAGTAQWPSTNRCESLSPCPNGLYADGIGGALYVDPRAAAGGDGSVATPFRTLDDALAASAANQNIALSKDTHVLTTTALSQVNVIGACAEQSVVTFAGAALSLSDGSLRGLHLEASGGTLSTSGTVNIDAVQISARQPLRMLNGVTIANRLRTLGGFEGAIWVDGGELTVTQASLEQAQGVGVGSGNRTNRTGNAQLMFEDVYVGPVVTQNTGPFDGHAFLSYGQQSTLTIRQAHIVDPGEDHIVVVEANADLSDLFLEGGVKGHMLRIHGEPVVSMVARRVVGIGPANGGLATQGAAFTMEDFVILNSQKNGFNVSDASTLTMRRGLIANPADNGFVNESERGAGAANATILFEDIEIKDAGAYGVFDLGSSPSNAMSKPQPVEWNADRVAISGSGEHGVYLRHTSPFRSRWSNITIEESGASGLFVRDGAVSLDRVRVQDFRGAGIWIEHHDMGGDGEELTVSSSWTNIDISRGLRGAWMSGLRTQVDRMRVRDVSNVGVFVMGSEVDFLNLSIDNVDDLKVVDLSGVPSDILQDANRLGLEIQRQIRASFRSSNLYNKCIGSLSFDREPGTALFVCGYRGGSGSQFGLYSGDVSLRQSQISNATQGTYIFSFAFGHFFDAVYQDIEQIGVLLAPGNDPEMAVGEETRFDNVARPIAVE